MLKAHGSEFDRQAAVSPRSGSIQVPNGTRRFLTRRRLLEATLRAILTQAATEPDNFVQGVKPVLAKFRSGDDTLGDGERDTPTVCA